MFLLQRIKIQKHPIFGNADLSFDCAAKAEGFVLDGNMTSVIIGRNGIGKSYFLRSIIDIFKTIDALVNGNEEYTVPEVSYRFEIQYMLNGHMYLVSDLQNRLEPIRKHSIREYIFEIDGTKVNRKDFVLPRTVIASSMTIADKYPTPSVGIYKYRGVRSEKTPSTTGTRTIIRKTVEGIMDSLAHKHSTRDDIALILSELGFQSHLEIRYRFRYKDVFLNPNMNQELLNDIYTNWANYFKGRSGEVWGTKYYKTLSKDPDKIEMVCDFLRRFSTQDYFDSRQLIYDVFDEDNTLVRDSEALKLLSNLDILSFPEFLIYKKENVEGYEFTSSSSGETQQICQFISIMSAIESNSLILIDEPENSSHPNWQMKYIGWLQKIFQNYRDCHFLIATHSHFLLTDMRPDWSNIIALDRIENGLSNIAEGMNTFCWSTDDILYRVFHVRNTRNRAFEDDIMRLYSLIEEGKKTTEDAKAIANKLSDYLLPGNDPLLKLLDLMKDA